MKQIVCVALLCVSILLLVACHHSTSPDESFSADIALTGSDGLPMKAVWSRFPRCHIRMTTQCGRPVTVINVSVPSDTLYATVSITDYWGTHISMLAEGHLAAGQHSFSWNGRNDDGECISDGVYKMVAIFTDPDTDDTVSSYTGFTYLYQALSADYPHVKTTDTAGCVRFTDITPLPGLYAESKFPNTVKTARLKVIWTFLPYPGFWRKTPMEKCAPCR
jgi:hypothetical protein